MSQTIEASRIVGEVRATGYARIDTIGNQAADLERIESLLNLLGQPIKVFRRHPFWKPLAADPQRPSSRSGGTGLNSLHIDCVNAEFPPDFVCLYCVRPDPLGGGMTMIAPLTGVEDYITAEALDSLSRPIFRDGAVYDLDHVGVDINPFPVRSEKDWHWRYTGRLLEAAPREEAAPAYAALLEFDRVLMSRVITIMLKAGESLILDQRKILHGRLPLGHAQDRLPNENKRLLIQAYCKDRAE